ncbi:MAG: endoproteinase ArgC [Acidovorax sp.]|uniref:trypsin-like serine peptidase n=1 Tax=Acidovorax sp. TaxID=1872122 RepID=UPI0039E709D6
MLNFSCRWTAGLGVVLALGACGGGGGGDTAAETSADDTATTTTVSYAGTDRIEPLDTALSDTTKSVAEAQASGGRTLLAPSSVRLGPVGDVSRLLGVKAQSKNLQRGPRQIGVARDLAATATRQNLLARLQWTAVEGGGRRAAISFTSDGARGVRVGVLVRSLPAGTVLRFHAQAGTQGGDVFTVTAEQVLQTLQRNLAAGDTGDAARTYWGPDFGGAETTLELELAPGAQLAKLDIAVPTLSHFFVAPSDAAEAKITKVGEAGTCNIDVSCRPELAAESRSVARMVFVDGGASYLCTGTLVNDATGSTTPYFLSAHHCISKQTVASTLTTDWFYHSTACNSGSANPSAQRVAGGAQLLYASASTDTSFMRLNASAPQGALFAGSYFGSPAQTAAAVVGIHHPMGDLQKTSSGAVAQYSNCANEVCVTSTAESGRFLTVGWSEGVTEGGSSGSGLFYPLDGKRYLVGQLYGGYSSCADPAGQDQYGRFDTAFRASLKNWLMPDYTP